MHKIQRLCIDSKLAKKKLFIHICDSVYEILAKVSESTVIMRFQQLKLCTQIDLKFILYLLTYCQFFCIILKGKF